MKERQKGLGAHPSDRIDKVGVKNRLAPSLYHRKKDIMVMYIIWDATGTGTSETHKECMEILALFCETNAISGIHAQRQWTSCEIDHWCLWHAACELWGYPYFELSQDWYTQDDSKPRRDDLWGKELAFWMKRGGILRTSYERVQGSKVSPTYPGGTNKAKSEEINITEKKLIEIFYTHLAERHRYNIC